jgi:hypothetical protein
MDPAIPGIPVVVISAYHDVEHVTVQGFGNLDHLERL